MKIIKIEQGRNEKEIRVFTKEYPRGVRIKLTLFEDIEGIKKFLKDKLQARLDARRRYKNIENLRGELNKIIDKEI